MSELNSPIKDESDKCPICLEDIDNYDSGGSVVRTFQCGHKAHLHCIRRGNFYNCSICRKVIDRLCMKCMRVISDGYIIGMTTTKYCGECLVENLLSDKERMRCKLYDMWKVIVDFEKVAKGIDVESVAGSLEPTQALGALRYNVSMFLLSSKNLMLDCIYPENL